MFVSETRLTVRYAETDRMGIVHHSNYPIWFEAGRTDFIRKLGIPYSEIEQRGLFLPLIELKCKFIKAAKYEDDILIKTCIKELTCTRVVFSYEAYANSGSSAIATGETIHVWTNRELRPVNIRKYMPDVFDLLTSSIA